MKKQAFETNKTKKKLRMYEENGKQVVVWKLKPYQLDLVTGLGYETEPFLFYVHTKYIPDFLRKKYSLLEQIHYAKKAGKSYLACVLSKKDQQLLKEHGISFCVLKYKIHLQRRQYRYH